MSVGKITEDTGKGVSAGPFYGNVFVIAFERSGYDESFFGKIYYV